MISKEDILALAQLARLTVSDEQAATLQKDMTSILDYVGQVSSVPLSAVTEEKPVVRNVTRVDTPHADGSIMSGKGEAIRAAFPKEEKHFNVVRKIIEK